MSAFDRAVRLGREAEAAAPQESQRLHAEAHAAFKQLLGETTDVHFKRELRVLIDYHARRKAARSSVVPPTPNPAAGLYSPLTQKPPRAPAPPAPSVPPPPRALLSVLVACEEMQRFEEEFINLVPRPPPPFPVRPESGDHGGDNEDGFYEVSKLDLSSKRHPASAQPASAQPSREAQHARNRLQYYMAMEREQLKRKTEEYWTLAGIVRIASQELDKALAKQQVEVNLLQEKIKEERRHRHIAEAKLAELHRAYPSLSSTVSSFGV